MKRFWEPSTGIQRAKLPADHPFFSEPDEGPNGFFELPNRESSTLLVTALCSAGVRIEHVALSVPWFSQLMNPNHPWPIRDIADCSELFFDPGEKPVFLVPDHACFQKIGIIRFHLFRFLRPDKWITDIMDLSNRYIGIAGYEEDLRVWDETRGTLEIVDSEC